MAQLNAFRLAAKADSEGKSLAFDTRPDTALDSASKASMLVRFRVNDEDTTFPGTTLGRVDSDSGGIELEFTSTGYNWKIRTASNDSVEVDANRNTGSWEYRVVTVDLTLTGNEVKAYTPGTAVSGGANATGSVNGATLADNSVGTPLLMFANQLATNGNGTIDYDVAEVAIWEGVLSDAEIDDLDTNEALNITPSSATLLAAYVCKDESSGDVADGDANLSNRATTASGVNGYPDLVVGAGPPTYVSDGPTGLTLVPPPEFDIPVAYKVRVNGDDSISVLFDAAAEVADATHTVQIRLDDAPDPGNGTIVQEFALVDPGSTDGEGVATSAPLPDGEYYVTIELGFSSGETIDPLGPVTIPSFDEFHEGLSGDASFGNAPSEDLTFVSEAGDSFALLSVSGGAFEDAAAGNKDTPAEEGTLVAFTGDSALSETAIGRYAYVVDSSDDSVIGERRLITDVNTTTGEMLFDAPLNVPSGSKLAIDPVVCRWVAPTLRPASGGQQFAPTLSNRVEHITSIKALFEGVDANSSGTPITNYTATVYKGNSQDPAERGVVVDPETGNAYDSLEDGAPQYAVDLGKVEGPLMAPGIEMFVVDADFDLLVVSVQGAVRDDETVGERT